MGAMSRCVSKFVRLCFGFLLVLGGHNAYAGYGDETADRLKTAQRIAPITDAGLGETISPYNGSVRWHWVDVSIPGSSRLKVEFGRVSDMSTQPYPLVAAGAALDIPVITSLVPASWTGGWTSSPPTGYSSAGTSAQFPSSLYSQGFRLEFEGQSETLINRSSDPKMVSPGMAGTFPYTTKSGWVFQIVTAADGTQSLMGYSPTGLRYTFNKLIRIPYSTITHPWKMVTPGNPDFIVVDQQRLYVTRVDDLFGNHVDYNWNSTQLYEIRGTDLNGEVRLIQINYSAPPDPQNPNANVSTVVANGRTWTYTSGGITYPDGSTMQVSGTTPADKYVYDTTQKQYLTDDIGSCAKAQRITPNNYQTRTIKYPSGVQVAYTFIFMRFGRTNVPFTCRSYISGSYEFDNQLISPFEDSWALTERKVTGAGLVVGDQQYSYSGLNLGYKPGSNTMYPGVDEPALPNYRTTTITREDGTYSIKTYGRDWTISDGQLLSDSEYNASNVLLRQTQTTFIAAADVASQPFPASLGGSTVPRSDPLQSQNVPVRQTIIIQDGVTFTSYVNSYDVFARATSIRKYSSLGYSKTDNTDYYDNTAHWVLGQNKRHYNADTGIIDSRTEYDPNTALPLQIYAFEKLKSTLVYNADGTLANVKDGNNNQISFVNWKRGIPQTVTHADNTVVSASVDDNGWIRSVTDENGYVTGYGYDAMGRVSAISYPNESNLIYNTTTITFAPASSGAYGLPAGYWQQITQTGNRKKVVYFDALWRPVVEENYDTSNVNGTLSQAVTRYSTKGQVTFQAYPQRTLDPNVYNTWGDPTVNPNATGSRSTYDPLGRVTQLQQDSELGTLTTTTEYLSGFQVRVTNPRSYQTTNGYQVYDQPNYDQLAWSAQPEGKNIQIARNYFGLPGSIKQYASDNSVSITRTYVYNANMELCKAIEPETSSTVMSYDAAGNVAWSVTGGTYPDTASCNVTEAYASGRRIDRTYDARNHVLTMAFPDGRSNQAWAYTPDGLPSQIITYNDPNNGAPVVNNYSYNKRRLLSGETSSQTGWYGWSIGYGYDANASLSVQTYPTGMNVSYAPNALGQPTAVTSSDGWTYASGVSYYPNGGINQFTYGNGVVHTMSQNTRQLPARSTDAGVINYSFAYDANGNPTTIADDQQGSNWSRWITYDGLDRMTDAGSCSFGGDCWHHVRYNALDNITSWKLAGVKDYASYIYDASNRLTQINNTAGASVVALGYDLQGNLQTKSGQNYAFDYGNRLRSTNQEWYRYDGLGRRVLNWRSTEPGVLSIYSQPGQLIYDENYRASGRKASEYIYLSGSLITIRARNIDAGAWTVTFQHTDALGSPVAVTNTSGQVVDRTAWEPYGAVISKPSYDGVGYTGHMMDSATGLTYMQQRYYDPTIGRFLSTDPIQANANTGASFNRYAYANNNPYKFTDPDGRSNVANTCSRVGGESCSGSYATAGEGGDGGATSGKVAADSAASLRLAAPHKIDPISDARISGLNEKIQQPARDFLEAVFQELGINLRIVQGLRTTQEQDDLYAQGRTAPGSIVTNAKGGQSYHNFGLAIDVVGLTNKGGINWNVNYKAISAVGARYGFEWGGSFKSIKDMPHFQMTFGLSLKELREGKTP